MDWLVSMLSMTCKQIYLITYKYLKEITSINKYEKGKSIVKKIEVRDPDGNLYSGEVDSLGDINLYDRSNVYLHGTLDSSGTIMLYDESGKLIWGKVDYSGSIFLEDRDEKK